MKWFKSFNKLFLILISIYAKIASKGSESIMGLLTIHQVQAHCLSVCSSNTDFLKASGTTAKGCVSSDYVLRAGPFGRVTWTGRASSPGPEQQFVYVRAVACKGLWAWMHRSHLNTTKLGSLGVVRPAEKAHCFCQAPYPEALSSLGRNCEERKGEVGI